MLTSLVSEQWTNEPFSAISLDCDPQYFPLILMYIQDGEVHLPADVLKTYFLEDMSYCGIKFDSDKIFVNLEPALLAFSVVANRERIDAFHRRVIKGDLQRNIDDAQKRLDAAKAAHFIMDLYSKEQKVSFSVS